MSTTVRGGFLRLRVIMRGAGKGHEVFCGLPESAKICLFLKKKIREIRMYRSGEIIENDLTQEYLPRC
jgi:hypothetical protein